MAEPTWNGSQHQDCRACGFWALMCLFLAEGTLQEPFVVIWVQKAALSQLAEADICSMSCCRTCQMTAACVAHDLALSLCCPTRAAAVLAPKAISMQPNAAAAVCLELISCKAQTGAPVQVSQIPACTGLKLRRLPCNRHEQQISSLQPCSAPSCCSVSCTESSWPHTGAWRTACQATRHISDHQLKGRSLRPTASQLLRTAADCSAL